MRPTTASVVPLAQRWADGDRAAGSELVRVHDDWILAYARTKTLPGEHQDDVAQVMRMAFLSETSRVVSGEDDASLRRRLKRAMRGDAWNERQLGRSQQIVADDDVDTVSVDAVSETVAEVMLLLDRASLTDRQRLAVLGIAAGMLTSEVAEHAGWHRQIAVRELERGMKALQRAAGVTVVAEAQESNTERVEAALARGDMSGPALAELLGLSGETTRAALRKLQADGVAVATGSPNKRVYALAKREEAA